MASSNENEELRQSLNGSTRIRVADITFEGAADRHLEAYIVLVWPYSSATKELSLLLAEKDVSLTKAKGQVKVTFHDACAREIACAKPGIGYDVCLSLQGAEVVQEQDQVSTPGQKAGFGLHFSRQIEILLSSEDDQTRLIRFASQPALPASTDGHGTTPNDSSVESSTTLTSRTLAVSTPPVRTAAAAIRTTWLSSPLTEDDGFTPGRGRKRTKFARHSGAWRLDDGTDDHILLLDDPRPQEAGIDRFVPEAGQDTTNAQHSTPDNTVDHSAAKVMLEAAEHLVTTHQSISKPVEQDMEELKASAEQSLTNECRLPPPLSPAHIPVEYPSPQDSTPVPAPRREAIASPDLSAVSPQVQHSQNASAYGALASKPDVDANASDSDVLGAFLEAAQAESLNGVAIQAEALDQLRSADQLDKARPADVPEPSSVSTFDVGHVDLDALQQQIDLMNASQSPRAVGEEIVEDDDLYGPHPVPHSPPQTRVFEDIPAVEMVTRNEPIIVDDDDHEEPETDEPSASEDEQASVESESIVSEGQDVKEDVDIEDHATSDHANQDQIRQDDMVRQELDLEDESGDESAPTDLGEESALVGNKEAIVERDEAGESLSSQPETALAGQQRQELQPGVEDGLKADAAQTVSDDTRDHEPAVQSPLSPLPDPDQTRKGSTSPQAIEGDFGTDETDTKSPTVDRNLYTPQATQLGDTAFGPQLMSPSALLQTLPVPEDDQQETVDVHATAEIESTLEHDLPQVDGPFSETRPRRSIINKPPFSENLHSEYFTPRKARFDLQEALSEVMEFNPQSDRLVHSVNAVPAAPERMNTDQQPEEPTDTISVVLKHPAAPIEPVKGTRTEHGYYIQLSDLDEYFNQLMDIMAVCTANSSVPEHAKSGTKDFYTTIHLADTSAMGSNSTTITAQIFRPHKNALPSTKRGDVLLLRNFKVQTMHHKPLLLSTDESAWVVFHLEDGEPARYSTIITGPPVEYGHLEDEAAVKLFHWWSGEGQNKYPDLPTKPTKVSRSKSPGSSRKAPPPPLELRRSPRTRRQNRSNQGELTPVTGQDASSPSFNPQSPTFLDGTRESMPPPSASLSLRSAASPTLHSSGQSKGKPRTPRYLPEATPLRRPLTRSQREKPVTPIQSETRDSEHGDFSEDNSVITSASDSSRRHRRGQRSTSLIHKLRDGTQWVDVENVEAVSVSTDGADSGVEDEASVKHPRETADPALVEEFEESPHVDAPELTSERPYIDTVGETPNRRGRAKSRKTPVREQPEEQAQQSSPPRPTSSRGKDGGMEGRVTRSKAAKSQEPGANVHELRDGSRYQD